SLNLNNNEIQLPWYLEQIEIENAWEITKGLSNLTIAVIDSGIDFSHPALNHSSWINPNETPDNNLDDDNNGYIDDINGWDFVNNDNNIGYEESDPISNHGTFIAGIIVGPDNDSSVFGIAPNVKIMALRIVTRDNLLVSFGIFSEAIEYAIINGADVISCSIQMPLGIPGLRSSIQRAENRKIPFISSTGNTLNSEGGGKNSIVYPASYPESIAVGASNPGQEKADYSNYGEEIDLVAPVGDQNYVTREDTIQSTDLNAKYRYNYGTSLASPQVAAVISLMKSVNFNLSVADIRSILYETAIDINRTGWDEYTGHGIVNASAAVMRAQNFSNITAIMRNPFPFPSISLANEVLILIIIAGFKSLRMRKGRKFWRNQIIDL
ncbi:MAG: S8 family serine peptidase, partial [Candidatus Kariarchaeaceae archaeon]